MNTTPCTIPADEVYRFDSGKPGAIVAIVGGTHGNEETGVNVIRTLLLQLLTGIRLLEQGVLYLVIGNPEAKKRGTRGSYPGADLNRCFTKSILEDGDGNEYEHWRARELAGLLKDVEIGIDIHATSKPSVPFVFSQPLPTEAARRIYQWFTGATKVVLDPNFIFAGQSVALDEYFARRGGIGLCYETGFAEDTNRMVEVVQEMCNALAYLKLFKLAAPEHMSLYYPFRFVKHGVYQLENAIIHPEHIRGTKNAGWKLYKRIHGCKSWRTFVRWYDAHQAFRWAEGTGEYGFQPFAAETTIAWLNEEPFTPSYDGVVIFPKARELMAAGKPVGYLAKRLS